ncbi:Snx4p ASCRUDRAFT_35728 [Ascoidea rubescens DSM 1968]|uniref:Sorting nexin-4 n=1 Tax=Ascoidea rubescens DSM 1968 TaxID=1344418 RepID=A0A1D2VFE9_9ASCO|nr:hypothetical protein ASCRUDRAFT_35728 [Ascoidea rubescens DSM 1968]ODV60243.1 hypothetical protein ASCRUDRAFT_35728 [Ascoidea rubescens DSM 1968]
MQSIPGSSAQNQVSASLSAPKINVSQLDSILASKASEIVDDETIYINSIVSSPQKESDGQNAFISYLIETHTNNPVFQSKNIKVRRRFSDFYLLYQCLLNDYPASIVPPLPDKQRLEYIKGDRFGYDFTNKRCSSLNRFLKRLSLHPVLKRAKIYLIFLESADWNSYKKNLNLKHSIYSSSKSTNDNDKNLIFESISSAPSMVDTLSDALMNAFKSPQQQPNKEFLEINERCNKLNENITKIDKVFQKYVKKIGDLDTNYLNFSKQVLRLNELEIDNDLTFDSILNPPPINNKLSYGLNKLKTYIDNDYITSLKDLENYIYSIKSIMKLKEQKQLDYEALTEYLSKAINEKNTITNGGSTGSFLSSKFDDLRGVNTQLQKKEKLIKLNSKIELLEKEVAKTKKITEIFENEILHEVQYFDVIKNNEIKDNLINLGDNYITFYKDMISTWEDVEKGLEKDIYEYERNLRQ